MFVKLPYCSLPVATLLAASSLPVTSPLPVAFLPVDILTHLHLMALSKPRLELNSHVIPVNLLLAMGFISERIHLLFGPQNFTA